ncbi:MAG TPA: single-stranded-DNA-specific exonuclease RecJ [Nitrospiraceae bacterium]|nr:single-stranded-DNA-specific exonuclease RecJ [Nitrospiraceae bacterium]
MHRNWLVSKTNREFLAHLSRKLSISPVLAQVLVNRGMKDAVSIKDFLYPSLKRLHDPFLMPDMRAAVDRLKSAIDGDETVLVHGDYDADGITATALLVSTLSKMGLKTCYHIPNRITEGYGLSNKGIEKARAFHADLIITADCGISSEGQVAAAVSMGMDVIITDHHEPPERLPAAAAVIDPHRIDSLYPFKYLSGVGVAFKLIQALVQDMGRDDVHLEDLLDLVALGTIADSVPLTGENRIFVTYGLKKINDSLARTGIRALKEVAGVNGGSRAGSLSFSLIPRINAAGRLDDAGAVVELFLTEDEARAGGIAVLLEEQNRTRQRLGAEVMKSALAMIAPDDPGPAIVLSSPDWHPGVIGIVASRLVDMFYRPVFLFSVNGSVAKGSARSIPSFHLYRAIAECAELLVGYGGHRQAAGLRLDLENLSAFRDRMNKIVEDNLTPEDMVPVLEIDAAVRFSDLTFNLINELALLEPYGDSNKQPVLGAKDIEIVSQKIVGNNHLKMQLGQENLSIDTIGFSMGKQLENLGKASSFDIAFVLGVNEWNGSRNLQLQLRGIRPRS